MCNRTNSVTLAAVVPVYNVSAYLDRCMKSILEQTRVPDEIILVDDGSTDGSGAICDTYANRHLCVKVIHQENQGLSGARNTGIRAARSDYVTFIDSDDWLAPTFAETLIELALATDSDMAMCAHARASSFEEFELIRHRVRAPEVKVHTAEEFMRIFLRIEGNRAVHYAWGKVYRRNVLEKEHFPVGMLNEDVEGCFKAVLNSKKVAETSEILYCYYVNETSITGKSFGENYLNLVDVWKRILEITKQRAPVLISAVDYNVKRADFTILCDSIIHGNVRSDKKYCCELTETRSRLKRNISALIRGPMVFQRKILVTLIAFAYRPMRTMIRALRH